MDYLPINYSCEYGASGAFFLICWANERPQRKYHPSEGFR